MRLKQKLVGLTATQERKLKKFAKETKRSVNEHIRIAVDNYLHGNGQ